MADTLVTNAGLKRARVVDGRAVVTQGVVVIATGYHRTRAFTSTAGGGKLYQSIIETVGYQRTRFPGPKSQATNTAVVWPSGKYSRRETDTDPIRIADIGDPSRWVFEADNVGNVTMVGKLQAGSIDIPSVSGVGLHVDTSGNFGVGGTTALNGSFNVAAVDPGATQYQIVISSNMQTGGLLLFSRSGAAATTMWTKTNPSDANELFGIRQDGQMKWGAGGASATDTILLRRNADELSIGTNDDFTFGSTSTMRLANGNFIEWKAVAAPTTPGTGLGRVYFSSVDKKLHVIDDAGVNTALGAGGGGGGSVATDIIWDLLGDTVYGTGADTAARLAGNTTTTQKFYAQTGTGAVSAAPVWFDLFGGNNTWSGIDTFTNAGGIVYSNAISTNTALYSVLTGEANERFSFRTDGQLRWGPGGASATDTILLRRNADELSIGTNDSFTWGATSASRLDSGNFIELKSVAAPAAGSFGRYFTSSADGMPHFFTTGSVDMDLATSTVAALALGTAAAGTVTRPHSPDDHVHPTTGVALLAATNVFTIAPQTITIDLASHVGLQINLAASQTGRAIQVTDSDGVQAFAMAGSGADILATQYAATMQIAGRRAEGTNLLPTAIAANSQAFTLGMRAYTGAAFATQDKAQIAFTAAELWTATVNGTYIDVTTTKKGGTTRAVVTRFKDDGGIEHINLASVATPPAGSSLFFMSSVDKQLHTLDDAGVDRPLGQVDGLARISSTGVAIANTETVVMSRSLPANYMAVGTTFHIKVFGTLTTGATAGTSTFRIRIGSTTLTGNIPTSVAPVNTASVTAAPFELDAIVHIVTNGATGTATGQMTVFSQTAAPIAFTSKDTIAATTATVVVDTTAAKLLELTYISGNAGSTATFRNGFIAVVTRN